jgi:hypothetical protein
MNKLLTLLVLINFVSAQDIVTYEDGTEYKGKVVERKNYEVVFLPEGAKYPQTIPVWKIINIKMADGTILDFSFITEKPESLLDAEKILAEAEEKAIKEKCESNSKLKFMVIPIKDDFYGLTEEVETSLDALCYPVQDNIEGLAYLDEKKIRGEDINDFHLTSIGKKLKLNFVVYGFTYTVEEPFNYAGNPSATAPYVPLMGNNSTIFGDVVDALILGSVSATEERKRSQAAAEAGTYLGLNLFQIDINTGEKKILINNSRFKKL